MKIVRNERTIFIDVDGTLVTHVKDTTGICPTELLRMFCKLEGGYITLRKNLPMIRLVKEEHGRGAYNVVWSRGGFQWAADVIAELGLTDYVDLVMSKPMVYFDDLEIKEWLKDRVWISPDAVYKHIPKGE